MTESTLRFVFSLTLGLPLTTLETVAIDTPASFAISYIFMIFPSLTLPAILRPRLSVLFYIFIICKPYVRINPAFIITLHKTLNLFLFNTTNLFVFSLYILTVFQKRSIFNVSTYISIPQTA